MAVLSSPLATAANNIVSIGNRSNRALPKAQGEFNQFMNFLEVRKFEIERIKLPDEKKIRQLANINIVNTFGNAGGLLGSLLSGALDLGGLVRGFFPGRGEKVGSSPKSKTPGGKPSIRGGRIRLGGIRALGIANAVFAGLDFATGLQQGEGIGKAAAGAGGSLAGSMLGGAIGQALIPVPGLGFVLGSMAGGFLGGYAADRAMDFTSGTSLKEKTEQKIKEQEVKQKLSAQSTTGFDQVVSRFDSVVSKFEKFVSGFGASLMGEDGAPPMEDATGEVDTSYIDEQPSTEEVGAVTTAEGGDDPSKHFTSGYGWRWGKMHNGADFAHPNPTAPVSILQAGVVDVGTEAGYGNWVAVKHDNGSETFYGHLSRVNVKKGQRISPGTVICNQGSTGRSTGPHVHFEYRPGGPGTKPVNPKGVASSYFRFGGSVKVTERKASDVGMKLGEVKTSFAGNEESAIKSAETSPKIQPPSMQSSSAYESMVSLAPDSISQNIQPQMVAYYPSYSQGQSYIIDRPMIIASGGGGGGSQKPIIIPSGGGGNGNQVVVTGPSEGAVVNSLVKTILLTNLSFA